jgi:predicted transcriptional regulator
MSKELQRMKPLGEHIEGAIEEAGEYAGVSLEAITVIKDKRVALPEYTMIFSMFSSLASKNLTANTCKVLLYFVSLLQYENLFSVDIMAIAEHCRIGRSSVKRAINELVKQNVIMKLQHPNDKRRNDYMFNPNAVWRGTGDSRRKAMSKLKRGYIQLGLFEEPGLAPIRGIEEARTA